MIIPININVLGTQVRIKMVTEEHIKSHDKDNPDGYYEGSQQCIFLSEKLDNENLRRVLLHELFHAYLTISGQTNYLKSNQEEALCFVMESWINLFRDSEFVEFMQDEYY